MAETGRENRVINWVALLPAGELHRTGSLRLDRSAQAVLCEDTGILWLRGQRLSLEVLSLPFQKLYRLGEKGRLFPLREDLPALRLDESLDWEPLSELIVPAPPVTANNPVQPSNRAEVRLVRAGAATGVINLLKVEKSAWFDYATNAPGIRLAPLVFAASTDEVLVWGKPLPALRGDTWAEEKGVAIPAGFRLEPEISIDLFRESFQPGEDELLLLHPNGTAERIPRENFVPATRTAVRLTGK